MTTRITTGAEASSIDLSSVITSRERFRELAAEHRVVPVVATVLADGETPLTAYSKLAHGHPGTFLFESAENGRSWSRYSFIGAGSRGALTVVDGEATWLGDVPAGAPTGGNPLDVLRATLDLLRTDAVPDLPPLTSGLVGYLSYDTVRRVEDPTRAGDATADDLHVPELMMLLATDIAVVDHHEGTIILIANAVNWDGTDERVDEAYDGAVARVHSMADRLASLDAHIPVSLVEPVDPSVRRLTSEEDFHERVTALKEDILDGEAFQVVLSQRFEIDTDADPLDIYRVLRRSNPSPYMYLLTVPTEDWETAFTLVGSSPEALVTVSEGRATMHPIAGSRPRGRTEDEDLAHEADLLVDEKENSEHLMLVDLARNDLGRVCTPGSVEVTNFRRIERYSHIMHIVSTVIGDLEADRSALDAVLACFPAGTLSGAPKPRALELIEHYENTRRGVYGGTVGYFDFAGNADQAIAIRTGMVREGTVVVQAGAGIVADSRPEAEDLETRNKAMAVVRAAAAAGRLRPIRASAGCKE